MTPSEGGKELPQRVRNLLELGRLREQPSASEQIVAVWQKAVQRARDAELPGLSIDGSLRLAYDAGHLAALALLASYGLRTGSGHGHHEVAFATAAALGGVALAEFVADSTEIRNLRKGSMYDPVLAGAEDGQHALEWVRRILPPIRDALVSAAPELAGQLDPYP